MRMSSFYKLMKPIIISFRLWESILGESWKVKLYHLVENDNLLSKIAKVPENDEFQNLF